MSKHLFIILKSHWFIELADADSGGGGGGDNDNDNDNDNDDKAMAGSEVLAHIDLAKTICGCSLSACNVFLSKILMHSMNSPCFSS